MRKRGELLTVANVGTVVQGTEEESKVSRSLRFSFEANAREFIDDGAHASTISVQRLVGKESRTSGRVKTLGAVN